MSNINEVINRIVWWIPFKKLRNDVRFFCHCLVSNKNINNNKANTSELWVISPFRKSIQNDKDFIARYNKLIEGLDQDSIEIVQNIISKISKFNDPNDDNIYFSESEVNEINRYYEELNNKIIKIDNQCYMFNNKYFLNRNHFEMFTFHDEYNLGLNYIHNLENIKNKSIIDAGAWIGDTSIVLSYYTTDKVYAFEPLLVNYNEIEKNIKLNKNINNIIPLKFALGEKNEEISIFTDNKITESGLIMNKYRKNLKEEKVNMITLDNFVEKNNIKIGLIKMDLEGFEQPFLKGALNTIKKQKPILLISSYHNYSDFFDIKPMIENLNLGYKFKIVKSKEWCVISGTMIIAEVY